MMRRAAAATLLMAAACTTPKTEAPSATEQIARVIGGLRPSIAITGEAPVRWTLAERMQHYHVPGISIAVIDSGKIVWAKGFGVKETGGTDSVTPQTIFQAGSISKPTFALGVMRLVQDGQLNLDEDVNVKLKSWKVPENKFTAVQKVTLRRILSHNAGFTVHGFPGYEAGTPIPTVVQVLNGQKPANTAPVRVDTFPGAISRYSGGGTTVAMLLVTDVTGKRFPDFMKEMVLDPAGMTHSTYEQPLPATRTADASSAHEANGQVVKGKYHTYPEMSAAGLWTTPSDLATLAIELQHTNAGQSSKVVSESTFKQMLTVQKAPFGIGYAIEGTGHDVEFDHDGEDEGFLASFIAFAERGQGLVIMANGANGGSLMSEIIPSVADVYGWPSHRQRERTAVAPNPHAEAELVGRYQLVGAGTRAIVDTVSMQDGKLFMAAGDEFARDELLAETDSTFFTRSQGIPVTFDRNKRGRVIGMSIAGDIKAVRIR